MEEQELNREQELEVVKTAYFLEDQIATQTKELNQLNGERPVQPVQPKEPHLERQTAQRIPYPEINPVVELPKPTRWKKGLMIAAIGFGVTLLCMLLLGVWPFMADIAAILAWSIQIGLIYAVVVYVQDNKKYKQAIVSLKAQKTEEIKNSAEYIQKCKEIDEQNQQNQVKLDQELHERYARRYAKFKEDMQNYEQDVIIYKEETYPQWKEEEQTLEMAVGDLKAALKEVYGRNVLPMQYRNRAAVLYLAAFMGTSNYDLKFAIERYDTFVMQKAQTEQINIAKAQVALANEAIQNQEYANWLNEQALDMAEQGNDTLKSIDNWQKADIAVREYRRLKARKKAKKAKK